MKSRQIFPAIRGQIGKVIYEFVEEEKAGKITGMLTELPLEECKAYLTDYTKLEEALADQNSSHYIVYNQLKQLLKIRRQQSAFHPNATQFTLHLGDQLFGFWRQSLDRQQSLFCISNISDQGQTLTLADINHIDNEQWHDLISGQPCSGGNGIEMEPYQTVWITNSA